MESQLMDMNKRVLQKAAVLNPKGLQRFAKWLQLDTTGLTEDQVINLVYRRVARCDRRFRWAA